MKPTSLLFLGLVAIVQWVGTEAQESVVTPTGDSTDLLTDTWYSLSLKAFQPSYLTWIGKDSEKGKYTQLINTFHEFYEPNGPNYPDALWQLKSTSQNGYYTLHVKTLEGYTTFTSEESAGGRFIEVDTKSENVEKYGPTGQWRDDAYFYVKPSEESGYFELGIRGRNTGLVSFSSKESGYAGYFLEVVTNGVDKYKQGGTHRDRALWKFTAEA